MKRNRLIKSSNKNYVLSASTHKSYKKRSFIPVSLLGLTGIFITSIVLATSQPSTSSHSNIIDLPNLPATKQVVTQLKTLSPITELKKIKIPDSQKSSDLVSIAEITLEQEPITKTTPVNIDMTSTLIETGEAENIAQISSIKLDDTQTANVPVEQQNIIENEPLTVTKQMTTDSLETTLLETEQTLKKSTAEPNSNGEIIWHDITVKSGDNLSKIFPRIGLTATDVYNVVNTGKSVKPLLNLKPGQQLKIGLDSTGKLQELKLAINITQTLSISSEGETFKANTLTREVEIKQVTTSGRITNSLFSSAIKAGLSDKLTMELAQIFGWDIDFALDLREKDSFKVVYEEKLLDGKVIGTGAILAAEFINQGNKFQAVRYTDSDGQSNYYTPSGKSMKKAFNRTPVHFSRISSKFSYSRKHPKLQGVTRPHRGVDYAAATGTPILATGNGRVSFVGNKGGYGRTVILSHAGKYTTLYAHMSRYKKGLKSGKTVKQGDVIGYIGMSGTATGPHLHYEFRINGVHRNPLTVELPKAQSINKKYLADFKQKSSVLIAKLDTLGTTQLALNNP